jgi:hyperosmotically inducible protein
MEIKMTNQFNLKVAAVLVVFATSVAFSATTFARPGDINDNPNGVEFHKLDTDNDGTLSRAELAGDKLFTKKNFAKADLDKDGTLDQKEYEDFKSEAQNAEVKRIASDSLITTKVKSEIVKEEGFSGFQISVETHKGIVQLSGFVDKAEQITKAGELAKSVEGVKSVKNSLLVKS